MKAIYPWTNFENAPLRDEDRALRLVPEKSFIELDGFARGEKIYYLHLQSQSFVPFHSIVIDAMAGGHAGLEVEAFLVPACPFDQGKFLLLEDSMGCENCDYRLPYTSAGLWTTNSPITMTTSELAAYEKTISSQRVLQLAPQLTAEAALAIVTLAHRLTARIFAGWPLLFPEQSPYGLYRREN